MKDGCVSYIVLPLAHFFPSIRKFSIFFLSSGKNGFGGIVL